MDITINEDECSHTIQASVMKDELKTIVNFIMYSGSDRKSIDYVIGLYEDADDDIGKMYNISGILKETRMKNEYLDIIFKKSVDHSKLLTKHAVYRVYEDPGIISGLHITTDHGTDLSIPDMNKIVDKVEELIKNGNNMVWPSHFTITVDENEVSFIDMLNKVGRINKLKECISRQIDIGFKTDPESDTESDPEYISESD